MTDEPKVKPVFGNAQVYGNARVYGNAYAIWSIPDQEWELLTTFDNTDCEACGGECSVVERPV
jgi:hypothetical protein